MINHHSSNEQVFDYLERNKLTIFEETQKRYYVTIESRFWRWSPWWPSWKQAVPSYARPVRNLFNSWFSHYFQRFYLPTGTYLGITERDTKASWSWTWYAGKKIIEDSKRAGWISNQHHLANWWSQFEHSKTERRSDTTRVRSWTEMGRCQTSDGARKK